jgi:malonyl-CoA O-methyltransferase
MNTITTKIKKSFNKAKTTYDNACGLQKNIHIHLYQSLLPYNNGPTYIVDLGCGTGNCIDELKQLSDSQQLIGVDIADALLLVAKNKHPTLAFLERDISRPLELPHKIDLFYANMSLQWLTDLEQSFIHLKNQLHENGLFAFSLPIDGTFCEIPAHRRNQFLTAEHIIEALHKAHYTLLHTEEKIFIEPFSSRSDALRSIKKVGANCLINPGDLDTTPTHTNTLTYRIGFFIAKVMP